MSRKPIRIERPLESFFSASTIPFKKPAARKRFIESVEEPAQVQHNKKVKQKENIPASKSSRRTTIGSLDVFLKYSGVGAAPESSKHAGNIIDLTGPDKDTLESPSNDAQHDRRATPTNKGITRQAALLTPPPTRSPSKKRTRTLSTSETHALHTPVPTRKSRSLPSPTPATPIVRTDKGSATVSGCSSSASPSAHFSSPFTPLSSLPASPSSGKREQATGAPATRSPSDSESIVESSQSQEWPVYDMRARPPSSDFTFKTPTMKHQDSDIVPTSQSEEKEINLSEWPFSIPRDRHRKDATAASTSTSLESPRHPVSPATLQHSRRRSSSSDCSAGSAELVGTSQSQTEQELDLASVRQLVVEGRLTPFPMRVNSSSAPPRKELKSERSERFSGTAQAEEAIPSEIIASATRESSQLSDNFSQVCTSPPDMLGSTCGSSLFDNLEPFEHTPTPLRDFCDMFDRSSSPDSVVIQKPLKDAAAASAPLTSSKAKAKPAIPEDESETESESDDELAVARGGGLASVPQVETTDQRPSTRNGVPQDLSSSSQYDVEPPSIPSDFDEFSMADMTFDSSLPSAARDFLEMFDQESQEEPF